MDANDGHSLTHEQACEIRVNRAVLEWLRPAVRDLAAVVGAAFPEGPASQVIKAQQAAHKLAGEFEERLSARVAELLATPGDPNAASMFDRPSTAGYHKG